MNDEAFLGVPADALHALGCLTVAGGRLEWAIRTLAADLEILPGKRQASDLLKKIRHAASRGLPQQAVVSTDELVKWAEGAANVLNARHRPAHSTASMHFGKGPVLIHLRSRQESHIDAEKLMADATRLASVAQEGIRIIEGVRHSPRLGVFLPNVVLDDEWVPLCSTDIGGANLARPTEAELDEWWRTLGPFPRLE